jgi:hypothetical protein
MCDAAGESRASARPAQEGAKAMTDLSGLIRAEASAIAEDLASELRQAQAPHYRDTGESLLRLRCQRLVEAFLESCSGNPAPFESYVREITAQRMAEGYYLEEIQQALTLLERRAWQLAVDGSSVGNLVRHLSIITGTIGRAKDELGRAFFARKQAAEAALSRLRLEGLFAGTDGYAGPRWPDAEPEDELGSARSLS